MLDKLKPVIQLDSVMAISKTVDWLREQLEARRDGLLVMDCRAQELYESSHVETAINVAIPSLMLRRLKKGNLPVRSLLSDGEDRERFVRRCKTDTIVLYDEYSREWNENVDGGSVLGLLLRKMKDEGYKAFYLEGEWASFTFSCSVISDCVGFILRTHGFLSFLKFFLLTPNCVFLCFASSKGCKTCKWKYVKLRLPRSSYSLPLCFYSAGGFSKFQAEYPALCETNLDGSSNNSSSSSPTTAQVLGLGGLRISSDSSDIESDIDRDPSSATDSDGSPLCNPQPTFPVEILPHLYLGCAKDSTNLDVLEEYGIKYILNVTPNLPNLFENAGEFKYKQIPISDHWSQNLSQFFPEAISFIGR